VAQRIVGVTADVGDAVAIGGDDEAAHRLAEGAGARVARGGHAGKVVRRSAQRYRMKSEIRGNR
jgi:hypothetical protein